MSSINNQWPCKLKAEGKNKFWNLTGSAPSIALAWLASVMNKYSHSLMTWIEFSFIKMSNEQIQGTEGNSFQCNAME